MQDRARGHHLGMKRGIGLTDGEVPAMPVGPIHHRGDTDFMCEMGIL